MRRTFVKMASSPSTLRAAEDRDATRRVVRRPSSLAHAWRARRAKGRRGVVWVRSRRRSRTRGGGDVVVDVDVLFFCVVGSKLVERWRKVDAERDDERASSDGRR